MIAFQPTIRASEFKLDQEELTKNWFITLKSYGHQTLSFIKGEDSSFNEEGKLNNARNWKKQLRNVSIGVLFCGASSAITHDNLNQISSMFGLSLIVTSTTTMFRYVCEWYAEEVSKAQSSPSPKRKKKEGKNLSENTKKAIDQNIQFTRALFEQARNLGNVALKFYMLYTLVQFYDLENFPLPGMVAASAAYDLYEIGHTYSTGKTRNNMPIMALIDSYCKIVYAISLYLSWSEEGFDPSSLLTPIKNIFFQGLKIHGETGLNMALIQMFYNMANGVYSHFINLSLVTIDNGDTPLLPIVSTKTYPSMKTMTSFSVDPVAPVSSSSASQDLKTLLSLPSIDLMIHSPQESPIQQKKKVKTKGKMQENVPVTPPTIQTRIILSKRDQQRNNALERIQSYRSKNIVKKTLIDQEIRSLKSFSHDIFICRAGHGKQAITINGNEFKAFFEPSHGKQKVSKDEYQGYRKERILDALQVSYLYGWDEDKILDFMKVNNINRFYNIPSFLIHILWNRGRYE